MTRQMPAPRTEDEVEIVRLKIAAGDLVPNNPLYPAVIARDALGGPHDDADVRGMMERNGWVGTWTWTVFDYHHYHPDAFEALAVASGSATLMLGGPQGKTVEVRAGDIMILPPGFGHKLISMQEDFQICGAYPPGQEDYTVVRATSPYGDAIMKKIEAVPKPSADPAWGGSGPLLRALLDS